jgi:predicted pyridoxine 5'-phosphate oxidase superfamily flavin-nucleotide-binding protein
MQIPEKVKAMFDGKRIIAMATVGEDGMPNVVPMLQYIWHGDDILVIADMMMKLTCEIVKATGKVSFCAWEGGESYKLRGIAVYKTEGPAFEELIAAKPGLKKKTKGVVVFNITEVYDASKGPDAGKLIIRK